MNKRTTYIGIDPGRGGGAAAITTHEIKVLPFQRVSEARIISWMASVSARPYCTNRCTIGLEKVQTHQASGRVSAFHFGDSYGFLRGVINTLALTLRDSPTILAVLPQKWQQGLAINPRKVKTGETKAQYKKRLLRCAKDTFPDLTVWKETMWYQQGVCDALLIAHYLQVSSN